MLDFAQITNPISVELPCGTDPRSDTSPMSEYYRLKDVRTRARAAERSALIGGDSDESINDFVKEWEPIVAQVPEVLMHVAKDLEYTAWLIEGLCRTDGFAGLAEGFKVARLLIESQWDNLYPEPDEDGLETRMAPLLGLNGFEGEGVLLMPILSIPLTDSSVGQGFATWQIEQASQLNSLSADKQKDKINAGAITLKDIGEVVAASTDDFIIALQADITAAIDEFDHLSTVMDTAMQGDPQPTSKISEHLAKCQSLFEFICADRLKVIAAEKAAENEALAESLSPEELSQESESMSETMSGQAQSAAAKTTSGFDFMQMDQTVVNRAEAIKALHKIEEFFRTTEPHSPISYAIGQAIRWSELSLPELLAELINDQDARAGYFKLTGIPKLEDTN